MKVLFMGTPEFAVASLKALLASSHEVVGVVTQPDRALKHGKTEYSAVKTVALQHGLPVIQPVKIRNDVDGIKSFGADIAVTAAYGQILNGDVLNAFPKGVINVHASVLPKYRGASPIQSAIMNGETETGVTIMRTELGLDTGDVLGVVKTAIGETETAGTLTERLAELGAELLVKTLDGFDGITPVKQDDGQATHCKTISKSEHYIDFSLRAERVVNMIRALSPTPCAKTVINGEVYKIYAACVSDDACKNVAPGVIATCDKKLTVACGDGGIDILKIQAPSKRALDIAEFLRGKHFDTGVICAKPQQ